MIDVSDYIKSPGNKGNFENRSFDETKRDLEELHEYNIIFEELEKSTFFQAENSMHLDNDVFMQNQLIISEIKEKQEITNKLNDLTYNVGWLRAAIVIKDKTIINKAINNILKHENSSINAIVTELNSLRNKIDEFEGLHNNLLKSGLSLDTKTLMEQDFKEKHEKLNELYSKQKNIFLNLSSIFIKLTKDSVLKKKK